MHSQPIALYRFYDQDGSLLYVGIAENPRTRQKQHARQAHWWPEVDQSRTTVEWHEDRILASAAETAAIIGENPRYNIVGSPRRTFPKRPRLTEINGHRAMSITELRAHVGERIEVAFFRKEVTVITRHGRPAAAVISASDYEWLQERRARDGGA